MLGVLTLVPAWAQEGPPEQAPGNAAHSQYFSGFISEISPTSIVVTRKEPAESKSFVIDGSTKVEGKLLPNARVTVRFETTASGARALRIIVRR